MALCGLQHHRFGVGLPQVLPCGLWTVHGGALSQTLPGVPPPAGHGGAGAGCLLLRLWRLCAQWQCGGRPQAPQRGPLYSSEPRQALTTLFSLGRRWAAARHAAGPAPQEENAPEEDVSDVARQTSRASKWAQRETGGSQETKEGGKKKAYGGTCQRSSQKECQASYSGATFNHHTHSSQIPRPTRTPTSSCSFQEAFDSHPAPQGSSEWQSR